MFVYTSFALYFHLTNFMTRIVKNEFSFLIAVKVLKKLFLNRRCLVMAYIMLKLVA
jgi:hypothetical protein